MLISELHVIKKNYLYEGLNRSSLRSVKLWESAGHKIVEAQLTPDQVLQIFQQAEQGATAAGGNRTLVGKGKDAASAVNRAWEDLKTKVQNSGPIKNVDAMYDQAAEKLKQATGGDTGVMQYVQKYRDFAKKHPISQSLIYAALIAAAGISGAGLGGAAALGLFKMTDKLLQGEKFSSAAYSGAKTGAAAYAAGQVGKAMQGDQAAQAGQAAAGGPPVGEYRDAQNAAIKAAQETARSGADQDTITRVANDAYQKALSNVPQNPRLDVNARKMIGSAISNITQSGALREDQVSKIFALVVASQLNEGIMDTIKGAAGKAGQWLQTKGHNLTTKITADKLAQAWERAGSPMDSDQIAAVLKAQGVSDDVVASVYGQMKLPVPAAQTASTASTATTPAATAATPAAAATTTTTTAADAAAPPAQAGKVDTMLATLVDYVKQGGTVTPKQRGAIKDLWLRIGGAQLAETKRKKKNTP